MARLVGLGLTNREIADRLGISERTVGAHIQNILNKLGAGNRAQIAAWSTESAMGAGSRSEPKPSAFDKRREAPAATTPAAQPRRSITNRGAILLTAGVLLCSVFPADHQVQPPAAAAALSSQRGDLVFDAQFQPDGREFALRYVIGDPDASAIRFVNGGLEFSVLRSGGNTGNRPAVNPLPAFYSEYEISVQPNSNVNFWFGFSTDDPSKYGVHQLVLETGIEAMQLMYMVGGDQPPFPLGPQVSIDRLLTGRHFTISALVAPPVYRVFLDGVRVIDVRHESVRRLQSPNFAIFGDVGTVLLTALRVYRVAG